jgi:hypothetical protein
MNLNEGGFRRVFENNHLAPVDKGERDPAGR